MAPPSMLLADIDADGNDSRYSYDSAGNLISITDARKTRSLPRSSLILSMHTKGSDFLPILG